MTLASTFAVIAAVGIMVGAQTAWIIHALSQINDRLELLHDLLDSARERQVSEMYRRAYTDHPFDENGDEGWVLEAGRQSLGRDR